MPSPLTLLDSTSPIFPPVTINAYDVILGDEDGIVVISPSLLEEVLRLAEAGRTVDELCRQDILAGKGVKETFALRRGK